MVAMAFIGWAASGYPGLGHGFLLFAVFTALIFRPFDDWTFAFTGTWSRSSVSPSVSLRFNDASKDRLPTSHSESNSKLELRPFEVEHLQKDEKDPETESDHFFIPSDYDDLPRRFDRELLLNFFSSKPTEIAWRWSEIVQELWPTWDLWHREERLQKKKRTRGAKLRTALSRLGPVFVKIGQTLSERPDLIGDEAAEELKLLQQENVEFSTELAFATILEDLNHTGVLSAEMPHAYRHDPNGAPLFQSISHRPVAAASLGQVYKATTLDGRTVAVKVQRPGSLKQVALDWTCWALGLGVMDLYWGGQGDEYPKIADEVAEGVFKELDYHNEARNAELFLKKHRFLPFVTAPQWVPELTGPKGTARVLTLEWINGRKLQEIESEEERMKMVEPWQDMAVEACVSSLVFTGFVHADPHAGNLILTEDGRLAFLDFGLMGTVEPHVMEGFAAGIQHLLAERWLLLAKVMQDVGFMAVGETGGFKKVIDPTARIFEYTSCPDEEFAEALEKSMKEEEGGLSRFGALATALTKLSNNYHMVMPGYIILFIRTFLTLEGIAGVPEEPVKRRKKTVSKGELHCTQEMADHVHVLKRWEYPEPATGVVPRISLHAPCLWTSFAKASTKWAPSGQWYWKRTRVGELERVEIQHPNERPLSVLNITSSCNNCYNQMHRALSQNMFPLFGELTDLTYQWYQMQYGSGLVIMLPDPEAHSGLLKAQEYWRGTFEGLAHEFSPKYRMAYASTFDEDSRRWIRKEFGVTEFPAVVIQKADKPGERQDSRGHVFQGDITYQDLALQIQDANAGCFSWPHPMLTFGGMKDCVLGVLNWRFQVLDLVRSTLHSWEKDGIHYFLEQLFHSVQPPHSKRFCWAVLLLLATPAGIAACSTAQNCPLAEQFCNQARTSLESVKLDSQTVEDRVLQAKKAFGTLETALTAARAALPVQSPGPMTSPRPSPRLVPSPAPRARREQTEEQANLYRWWHSSPGLTIAAKPRKRRKDEPAEPAKRHRGRLGGRALRPRSARPRSARVPKADASDEDPSLSEEEQEASSEYEAPAKRETQRDQAVQALQGCWQHSNPKYGQLRVQDLVVTFLSSGKTCSVTARPDGSVDVAGWVSRPEGPKPQRITWTSGTRSCSWQRQRLRLRHQQQFESEVAILTLEGPALMYFGLVEKKIYPSLPPRLELLLEPRSLLVLKREAYELYVHRIDHVTVDVTQTGEKIPRAPRRTSLTLRRLKHVQLRSEEVLSTLWLSSRGKGSTSGCCGRPRDSSFLPGA
eukprot:g30371.t3